MPRLSVDIDLTYVPVQERLTSLAAARGSLKRIASTMAREPLNFDTTLQEDRDDQLRIFVSAEDVRIKIEVSPVIRGAIFDHKPLDIRHFVEQEFGFASTNVVSMTDLYGGKICAALDRQHPRDLFDVMLLLKNEGITREIFEGFLVYLVSHNRPMVELLKPAQLDLRRIFDTEFKGMTLEPVGLSTLYMARSEMLNSISGHFTDADKRFLMSIKKCEPQWDLLGLQGIDQLPAIRWKLQNLERMPKAKHAAAVDRLKAVLDSL